MKNIGMVTADKKSKLVVQAYNNHKKEIILT